MNRLEEIRQRTEAAKAQKEKGDSITAACIAWSIVANDIPYLLSEVAELTELLDASKAGQLTLQKAWEQDKDELTARAEAAETERDACKADLKSMVTQSVKDMEERKWTPPCRYCSKYFVCDYIPEESGCCFEWRGVKGATPNE